MSKKILSLLLALTLIFGVLPVSAFASEAENPNTDLIGTINTTIATTGTTDGGEASCTCESFCSDADCVVCKDDATQCFYYYCICEAVCAEGEANADCPICKDDFSKCAQAVEVPEFEALGATRTTPLSLSNSFNASNSAEGWEWSAITKTLTLSGMLLHVGGTNISALTLPAANDLTIELVAGTHNEIYINASDASNTLMAIICGGNLTIKGSGSLTINSSNGASSGAAAGAVGIYSLGNVTIEGGTIQITGTSESSEAIAPVPVAAIFANGEFNITGGTVVARSSHRALSEDYVVPAGNSYWKSEDTYTPGGLKYVSTGNTTNDKIGDSIKNLKIIPGENRTLYYNPADGNMYKTRTGTSSAYVFTDEITDVDGWSGDSATLTLDGIDFSTSALNALDVPAGTTIMLANGTTNTLTSNNTGSSTGVKGSGMFTITGTTGILNATGNYAGINGTSVTITGGVITATGSTYGIARNSEIYITGGTVTAIGNTSAFDEGGPVTLPSDYEYWTNATASETGATKGTGSYSWSSAQKYVKIASAGGINYTLYLNNSTGRLHKNNISGDDVTDEMAAAGAVVTGSVGAWILTLTDFEFETSAKTALHVVDVGTTINVIGNNTITTTATSEGVAIKCPNALKINGTGGSLNAVTNSTGLGFPAIVAGSLTVEGSPVITATTGTDVVVLVNAGNLNMTGGTLIATSASATGYGLMVQAGDLTMTGGTIYAKNGSAAASVSGNVPGNVVVKGRSGDAYTVDAIFFTMPFGKITTTPAGFPNVITDAKITVSGTPPVPPVPPVPPTPTPSGGGGSSKKEEPAKPIITPMDDKSSGTLSNAITSAANATNSGGKAFDVILKNVSNFTKENAAAILQKAKALGKKSAVSSDIMSEDGNFVEVRVTLDPELITKTVRLDGYIRQFQIFAAESRFKKHFDNKTTVVHLAQEGKFGQTAKIAAKVDLSGFDSGNLNFYSYDKKTNKYIRIEKPAYRIDEKGYLHFETDNGGDIIISNGPLTPKGQNLK